MLVQEQYAALNDVILPALEEEGIHILRRDVWSPAQAAWIRDFFEREVESDPHPGRAGPLAPLPEDPQQEPELHRPRRGRGRLRARGRHRRRSGPRTLPRFIAIPRDVSEPDAVGGDGLAFVMLSSVVHAHIDELFHGMSMLGCHQFRVTRNSELWVDNEEVENILEALEGELPERKYAGGGPPRGHRRVSGRGRALPAQAFRAARVRPLPRRRPGEPRSPRRAPRPRGSPGPQVQRPSSRASRATWPARRTPSPRSGRTTSSCTIPTSPSPRSPT